MTSDGISATPRKMCNKAQLCQLGAVSLIVGLLVILLAGCVSTPMVFQDEDVLITMVGKDQVEIGGRQMTVSQAVRRLRSQSVSTDTPIRIHQPPNISSETMGRTIHTLQRAGYSRVIFVGSRHIEVEAQ